MYEIEKRNEINFLLTGTLSYNLKFLKSNKRVYPNKVMYSGKMVSELINVYTRLLGTGE